MKLAAGLFGLGACLCGALLHGPAWAQDISPDIDRALSSPAYVTYARAHLVIRQALSEEADLSLNNPFYAQQVSLAFDVSMLETTKDAPYMYLSNICFQASSTQAIYVLRGVKKADLDPQAIHPRLSWEISPETAKLKSENYLRFQDELIAALGFGLSCRALQLQRLEAFLPQMPPDEMVVFRLGFADFQSGLSELVLYHALALRDPVRPENRRAALDLLLESTGTLAGGMTRETRRSTTQGIGRLMTGAGLSAEERSDLKKLQQALSRTDCGKACSFR